MKIDQEKLRTDLPLLAASLGHIIWGFGALFIKLAMRSAAPETMLSFRFLTAALLMTLMLPTGRVRVSFRGKRLGPLLLLAVTEPLCFYFESYGILYTNATFAGVVLAVTPVVAIALAMLFLREFPTRRQVFACLLPIAGVIVMTASGSAIGVIQPIGVAFLICSCLSSAAYKTVNRRSAESFTPFERTYIVIVVCAVVFALSALQDANWDLTCYAAPLADPVFCASVLILGAFSSVGANLLINYGAGKMPVAKLSSLGSLTTLCSAFVGILFLNEPITLGMFAGTILILVGIHWLTKE